MNACAIQVPKQVAISRTSPFAADEEPIQFLAPGHSVTPRAERPAPRATLTAVAPPAPRQVAVSRNSPFSLDEEPLQFRTSRPAATAPLTADRDVPKPFLADTPAAIRPAAESREASPEVEFDSSLMVTECRYVRENREESADESAAPIRQLALRAIFGTTRDLTADELLQRAQALPGIRHLAWLPDADTEAIAKARRILAGLGFGETRSELACGARPLEFIREGKVTLAVQNDGSFAPGTRETLILIARELGRL